METIIRDHLYNIRMLCESDFLSEQLEEKECSEKERKKMTKILLASVRVMLASEELKCSAYDWYGLEAELYALERKANARFNIYEEEE